MRISFPFAVSAFVLVGVGLPGEALAQTPDAQLRVRVSVAATSQGVFNFGALNATRVTVFAESGFQARLSSATGIVGPTVGTSGAGSTFDVLVDRLYTPTAAGAPNPYTVVLSWDDTVRRTARFGPVTLVRGDNSAGPYMVDNQAPPPATSIGCYPQPPRTESELYVFWSMPGRPTDLNRYELHRSSTPGFVPSAATLVSTLPFGTSNRVDTGRAPESSWYYCFRTIDNYGASSDRCTTAPCTTTAAPRPDAAVDVPIDLPRDVPADAPVDRPDAPIDAPFDAIADRTDALVDARIDVIADRTDALVDAAADRADALVDAAADRTDALIDVTADVIGDRTDAVVDVVGDRVDGASDAAIDRVDASIDLGGMAGFTSIAPETTPANTPFAYLPRAVSSTGAAPTGYRATGLPPGAVIDARTGAVAWTPAFADVGMMRTFTLIATLPGGMEVRQTVTLTVTCPDNDGDGRDDARCSMSATGGDCDDARSDTAPGAAERCNGVDDDCDGLIDEGSDVALCGEEQSCDPASRSCRPRCAAAAECTAAPQVCTRDRVCAFCTPGPGGNAAACASSSDGRACLVDSLGTLVCGCNTDADCGDATSGRVCDTSAHRCVSGCGAGVGRNGCPTGRRCITIGTGASARSSCSADCTSASSCTALPELALCPDTGTRRCVACRSDVDCAGSTSGQLLCDVNAGRCVTCLPGAVSLCVASGAGSACVAGGQCGCNVDSDCGPSRSARVCDLFSRTCRGGCRPPGSPGNTCPVGFTCVTTGAAAGRCVDADAGVEPGDAASSDATSDVPGELAADVGAPTDALVDASGADTLATQDVPTQPRADAAPDGAVPGANPDGGCGCRVGAAPSRTAHHTLVSLCLAGLALFARRRALRRAAPIDPARP